MSLSPDLPLQSSFLYRGKWTHEIDSIILDTLLRLKKEYECEGSVFPSHFIFEAQSLVEYNFGLTFEWWELVDRNTWANHLLQNHLLGAYHSYGDSAHNQLFQLFGVRVDKKEIEATLIVLSDSLQSHGHVCDAPRKNGQLEEGRGDLGSSNKYSAARRKLMFGDGGLQDLESTNKKLDSYYVSRSDGTMERVKKQYTGRVLPKETPPRSPSLAYSCRSSKLVTWFRMPRKPDI
ncbi:hypothetical protein SASPL_105420 [Salvia splendens]|uniref:Uncharacterized protein n=1 Tax=Salvia splendens TaxID=180675 RepID=A0A8X8YQE4_SALSN|nr:hypothetical protein SASPL_105420 [Salvia splendens]